MKIPSLLNSLVLGLGIGVAIFGLVSLSPQSGAAKGSLRVSLDPEPSSIVRVEKGKPFIVPVDRILVIKSIGDANGSSLSSIQVKVDGVPIIAAQMGGPSPALLGFPVTAKAGTTVTVEEVFPDPMALSFASGYLAPY